MVTMTTIRMSASDDNMLKVLTTHTFQNFIIKIIIIIITIIIIIQWNLYKWGLYKWGTSISGGILDFLYSFPYKWTSINGEVGNGGPRVFRSYLLHTK